MVGDKIHTIRKNYPLWKKRVDEVNAGNAIISIREWEGKPYNSNKKELFQIEKVGIERLFFHHDDYVNIQQPNIASTSTFISEFVAFKDGLSIKDFMYWFKNRKKGQLYFAIIHFTEYRYIDTEFNFHNEDYLNNVLGVSK